MNKKFILSDFDTNKAEKSTAWARTRNYISRKIYCHRLFIWKWKNVKIIRSINRITFFFLQSAIKTSTHIQRLEVQQSNWAEDIYHKQSSEEVLIEICLTRTADCWLPKKVASNGLTTLSGQSRWVGSKNLKLRTSKTWRTHSETNSVKVGHQFVIVGVPKYFGFTTDTIKLTNYFKFRLLIQSLKL